jgi:hypothetical protein
MRKQKQMEHDSNENTKDEPPQPSGGYRAARWFFVFFIVGFVVARIDEIFVRHPANEARYRVEALEIKFDDLKRELEEMKQK